MRVHSFAATALALGCAAASAQSMKPGLWEINTRMQGAGPGGGEMAQAQAQMQEALKNMPPEQRKMMEDMMAQRGMRMNAGTPGGGIAMQMCITKEMADRNDIPEAKGDCKTTSQQRSGNTLKVVFSCTNPPSSGEAQVTFASPNAYSSKVLVKTTIDGKSETVNIDSTGKWLAADCGSVKPPTMPRR